MRLNVTAPVFTLRSWIGQLSQKVACKKVILTDLDVNLVSTQYNGNVLADTLKIAVPIGDVLVSDSGGDIEHDNAALALDVISITKTTELFLSSGIPDIEADRAEICGKREWVDFDTKSGCTKVCSQEPDNSRALRLHDA